MHRKINVFTIARSDVFAYIDRFKIMMLNEDRPEPLKTRLFNKDVKNAALQHRGEVKTETDKRQLRLF